MIKDVEKSQSDLAETGPYWIYFN